MKSHMRGRPALAFSADISMLKVALLDSTTKTAKPPTNFTPKPCSVKAINCAIHQKEQPTFTQRQNRARSNPDKKILNPKPKTTPSCS